jgi:hypothetical protein
MGRIFRGALVGFLFALTVGVWPAGANVSGVSITNPDQDQPLAGAFASDGTPSGFTVKVKASATSNCTEGLVSAAFHINGPVDKTINMNVPSSAGTWTPYANWDTLTLPNGVYSFQFEVTEQKHTLNAGNCRGDHVYSPTVTAKLANPAHAPEWDGSPTAASDGSANVTLSWKKNADPDVVEYHIYRSGPDGVKEAVVSATNPAQQGCTFSSTSYTCTDPASNFSSAYTGSYSYLIKAMRSRPDYNTNEDPKTMCALNGGDDPCVISSGSDVRQVSLTAPAPTPSPSPSDSPTGSPSPGGKPTVGVRGLPGTNKGGTAVLSFGSGGGSGGSSYNDFYTGTYDENLPYQPKTVIIGDGTSTPGTQVEAAAVNDSPPNYRTIMLPVAGGLLAFLSAAHVRRLLVHF